MAKIAIIVLVGALSGVTGFSLLQREDATTAAVPADAGASAPAPRAAAPAAKPPAYSTDRQAQSYGTVCSTPKGQCTVAQAPINSFCVCNGTPGRIIR